MVIRTPSELKAQMPISQVPGPGKVYSIHIHDVVDTLESLSKKPVVSASSSYSSTLSQSGTRYVFNSPTPVSLTIPADSPVGYNGVIIQVGEGAVSLLPGTLLSRGGHVKTAGAGSLATFMVYENSGNSPKIAFSGDTAPSESFGNPYVKMFYTEKTSGESPANGTRIFHIDPSGNNASAGTTAGTAWQSWDAVTAYAASPGFQPGDRILFKRGSQYDTVSGFSLSADGSSASPIVIGAYGSGTPPVIANTGATLVDGVDTVTYQSGITIPAESSYITVRDLKITNGSLGNVFENGIHVIGTNVVVDNCEVTGCGHGVWLGDANGTSINATVQNCYIHDLTMVRNNTSNPDDDYGAVGVVCSGSDIVVRRNTIRNTIAYSYDYGNDGAAIELWRTVNNLRVSNNFIDNTANFTEFGGINTDTVTNVTFEHNVISRIGGLVGFFHNGGSSFALGSLSNVKFINNTVYVPNSADRPMAQAFGFSSPDGSWLELRNNIFSINYMVDWDIASTNYAHSHNLYHVTSGTFRAGYLASANEYQGDPIFVHPAGSDFRLMAGSAALARGTPISGYLQDYTGVDFSADATPDIGATQGVFTASDATYTTDYNWMGKAIVGQETVSRYSPATVFDSSGILKTVQANAIRFDHSPVSPYSYRGVRLDPAASNLVRQSGSLAEPEWGRMNTSVANSSELGLDGFSPMKLVTSTAANSSRVEYWLAEAAFTAGSQLTVTLYVKKGTFDWIFTSLQKRDFSDGSHSWFNLTTGTFGNDYSGTSPFVTASRTVRLLNNGIYEVRVTYNSTVETSAIIQISGDSGDGSFQGGSGVLNGTYLFGGIQIETGPGSSYIPTQTTVVTRPAESLSLPVKNGVYDILVSDDSGSESRNGVSVTGGAYLASPRSGQRHIQRVQFTEGL